MPPYRKESNKVKRTTIELNENERKALETVRSKLGLRSDGATCGRALLFMAEMLQAKEVTVDGERLRLV